MESRTKIKYYLIYYLYLKDMIDRARSYFLGAAFISTSSLFVFAGLFTSMPMLFNLNVFSDSTAQPNRSGELAITETAISGGSFLIGTVISLATLGSKTRKINSTCYKISN